MDSLRGILQRMQAPSEPLPEAEAARRIAKYMEAMTGRPYCPRCGGTGTLSERRLVPEMPGSPWRPIELVFYVGSCPDCNGAKDPVEIEMRRMAAAGLDPAWRFHYTFEAWDSNKNPKLMPQFRQVRAWAQMPSGSLLLAGDVGRGKTHLAIAVAIEALRAGLSVRYTEVEKLLDRLRAAIGSDESDYSDVYRAWIEEPTLLVLDDLGAEQHTQWSLTAVENLIAWRLIHELPMVITTNTGLEAYSERLSSRIHDAAQVMIVKLEAGGDVRPLKQVQA